MIRFALLLAAGVPWTLFFSGLAVTGGLLRAGAGFFDWIHRTWSAGLLRLAGVEVIVDGLEHVEPDGAQLFVSNHQSLFDILALFVALPVSLRFVAKEELSRIPVFASAMRQAGHVFIDRSDRAQAVDAMRRAGARMKDEGLSLGLFPEGTRSSDGRLGAFRRGTFGLAIETGTTLVPVAVEGGAGILPRGGTRLNARPVYVRCGRPIPLEGWSREDRNALVAETRERVRHMLDDLRSGDAAGTGGPGARGWGDGGPGAGGAPPG